MLRLSAALAKTSSHPFSQAVVRFIEARDVQFADVNFSQVRSIPGGGVEATLSDGTRLRLGSMEFVAATAKIDPRLRLRIAHALAVADQEAASVVAVSVSDLPLAMFLLTETMRPEASATA